MIDDVESYDISCGKTPASIDRSRNFANHHKSAAWIPHFHNLVAALICSFIPQFNLIEKTVLYSEQYKEYRNPS